MAPESIFCTAIGLVVLPPAADVSGRLVDLQRVTSEDPVWQLQQDIAMSVCPTDKLYSLPADMGEYWACGDDNSMCTVDILMI